MHAASCQEPRGCMESQCSPGLRVHPVGPAEGSQPALQRRAGSPEGPSLHRAGSELGLTEHPTAHTLEHTNAGNSRGSRAGRGAGTNKTGRGKVTDPRASESACLAWPSHPPFHWFSFLKRDLHWHASPTLSAFASSWFWFLDRNMEIQAGRSS